MKQFLFFVLIIATTAQAQPFISLMGTSKGVGANVGYLESQSQLEFNIGYNIPLRKRDVPSIINLSVGKCFYLTDEEYRNVTFTPSIGIAHSTCKDFTDYNARNNGQIITVKGYKPIYAIELGKDLGSGRIYVNLAHCGVTYFGVGIRGFFK